MNMIYQCADKHSKQPHSVQVQHEYDADPRVATKRDEGDGVVAITQRLRLSSLLVK